MTWHGMESKDTSPLPKCGRRGIGVAYISNENITKLASFNVLHVWLGGAHGSSEGKQQLQSELIN
jgi:hypothetical protein